MQLRGAKGVLLGISIVVCACESGSGSDAEEAAEDGGDDPHEAERIACVDKINELRATKGLAPYSRWQENESCVDAQATADENSGSPHGTFGDCGESAQNECLGGNIESCLEQMWAEKDLPGCAGCDACADSFNANCPGCDFYGDQTGDVCGHYVNMSAKYNSMVACGFSDGTWAAQDFR